MTVGSEDVQRSRLVTMGLEDRDELTEPGPDCRRWRGGIFVEERSQDLWIGRNGSHKPWKAGSRSGEQNQTDRKSGTPAALILTPC